MPADIETEMMDYCTQELAKHIPQEKLFPCVN